MGLAEKPDSVRLMRQMPVIATTNPAQYHALGRASLRNSQEKRAVKKGAKEMMTPTLLASVYTRAMFSSRKYRQTPHSPAMAMANSWPAVMRGRGRGQTMYRAVIDTMKRATSISMGVYASSSTLVETAVVPHTTIENTVARLPARREFAASGFRISSPFRRLR